MAERVCLRVICEFIGGLFSPQRGKVGAGYVLPNCCCAVGVTYWGLYPSDQSAYVNAPNYANPIRPALGVNLDQVWYNDGNGNNRSVYDWMSTSTDRHQIDRSFNYNSVETNLFGNTIVLAKGSAPNPADYLLSVAEQRRDAHPQADLTLLKSGSPDLLWSARIDGPGGNSAVLRQRASSAVSRVTACASRIVPDPAHSSAVILRLVFSACDIHDEQPDNTAVRLWRSIAAKQPGNAPALAALALAEAELADSARWNDVAKSSEMAALRFAARQHLEKARSLNGRLGETWAAEALLMPPSPYGAQFAVLEDGRARDPDCAPLYGMRSLVLQNVGRMSAAIDSARQAVELEPSAARWRANLAIALAYAGYTESARSELASAERIWPDSPDLQEARSRFELRFGDPVAMIRKIDRGSELPNSPPEYENGGVRAFLLARANPDRRNIEAATNMSSEGAYATYTGLQNLVTLGQVNKAYALLNDRLRMAALRKQGSYILFRANMRAFRLDRRFMPLADQLGLVQYWLSGNIWPDFCNDKDLPYSCRTEARRLHAKNA